MTKSVDTVRAETYRTGGRRKIHVRPAGQGRIQTARGPAPTAYAINVFPIGISNPPALHGHSPVFPARTQGRRLGAWRYSPTLGSGAKSGRSPV